jgi:hypothetical protein
MTEKFRNKKDDKPSNEIDPEKSNKVMKAMLQLTKIDIKGLKQA